ncbi:hypothetical protein W2_gp011 [Caulobacter phage W2]|uniref:DUF3168 domain-containing protein n=2 Tax=Kronosvirus TaxID=3425745 RepID=A0A386KSM2_9CAUD|nr:hypothetical protein [Caulobacter phage Kronos]WDS38320.1 hypothetical protein TMCBR4_gp011 [Caulobacter phage TMCBR4]WDS38379.1 hypothetical protein W2_gp011 [Caulobacter phage W2]
MADHEDAFFAHVTGNAAFAALASDRLYPVDFPQRPVYPAAVYQVAGGQHLFSQGGSSGLARKRLQVDCYAEDYDTMKALAGAVIDACHGFKGFVAIPDSDPVEVQGLFCTMEHDAPESRARESGPKVRRRTLEFAVWA